METCDEFPPLGPNGLVPWSVPAGTVIDRWDCPSCGCTFDVIHRAGRPRIYCSHACRQRAYRWRRDHRAHTSVDDHPDAMKARSGHLGGHAMRHVRDPAAGRLDRRGRQLTVCGLLARPKLRRTRVGDPGTTIEFRGTLREDCRTCVGLIQPRIDGRMPPGAIPSTIEWVPDPASPFALAWERMRQAQIDRYLTAAATAAAAAAAA